MPSNMSSARACTKAETVLADLVCLSHLRWNSVFQRPHHIMSRLASRRDVLFVEEPVPHRGETEIDVLRVAPRLNVLQPRIPCEVGGFGSGKQNGLESALRKLLRSQGWGEFVAWLYTIARNVVCDRARQAGREEPLDDSDAPSTSDDVERRALLFRLVDTLPPAQRDVLVARFAEQRSIADVARQLGRSEGAVKQLQLRAIEALRAQVRGSHG